MPQRFVRRRGFILFMCKFYYFLKKDIIIWLSYRAQVVIGLLSGFIGIVQFGLIGKFIAQGNYFPAIERYGGDILAYFITGAVFMSYTNLALSSFKSTIQREQSMGTLEHTLLSATPLWQIFVFNLASSFMFTTANIATVFAALVFLFSVHITPNIGAALVVLVAVMLPLTGIGLLSASVILITKRGDPVGWIYATLSGLFSGIYYPVEILPKWLRPVSFLIPSTYGMDLLRKVLMRGYQLWQIRTELLLLIVMGVILLPIGIYTFEKSLRKAQLMGTLAWY